MANKSTLQTEIVGVEEAPIWRGSSEHCHHSDLQPQQLFKSLVSLLSEWEKSKRADWELRLKLSEYTIDGRFYSGLHAVCSWTMSVYRANDHKTVKKSVLEIREVSSEGEFSFFTLGGEFVQMLQEKQWIIPNSPDFFVGETDSECSECMEAEDVLIDWGFNPEEDDKESSSSQVEEEKEHILVLVKEISNKDAEASSLRYCLTQLLGYVQSNPKTLELISGENTKMVETALDIIYSHGKVTIADTLSIICLLELCKLLFEADLVQKEDCPDDLETKVEDLKTTWSKSVRVKVPLSGFVLKYPKSQQVESTCDDFLKVLQKWKN